MYSKLLQHDVCSAPSCNEPKTCPHPQPGKQFIIDQGAIETLLFRGTGVAQVCIRNNLNGLRSNGFKRSCFDLRFCTTSNQGLRFNLEGVFVSQGVDRGQFDPKIFSTSNRELLVYPGGGLCSVVG